MVDRMHPFYARRTQLLVAWFVHEICPDEEAELVCIECLVSAHGAIWYAHARRRMLAMLEDEVSDA
jgi:hypothetical protein